MTESRYDCLQIELYIADESMSITDAEYNISLCDITHWAELYLVKSGTKKSPTLSYDCRKPEKSINMLLEIGVFFC